MDWDRLFGQLKDRLADYDQLLGRCVEKDKARGVVIHCRKGCANCCTLAVNCSYVEAAYVAQSLAPGQVVRLEHKVADLLRISSEAQDLKTFLKLYRQQLGSCPFLDAEEACSAYGYRPFSCRSLLSSRPEAWCGVDFSALHPLEREAFLSSLDAEIVNFPTHYLAKPQELAAEYEAAIAAELSDAADVHLSGNFLYQVWLERTHGLSALLASGRDVLRSYLQDHALERPFLLHFR